MEPDHASEPERVRLSREDLRRRRMRSLALALVLAVLAILFYVITILRFSPGGGGGLS